MASNGKKKVVTQNDGESSIRESSSMTEEEVRLPVANNNSLQKLPTFRGKAG